jgi:hypothetical protein
VAELKSLAAEIEDRAKGVEGRSDAGEGEELTIRRRGAHTW